MTTLMQPRQNQLPPRRWLSRAMVIEFLPGGRRELERLEAEKLIVREYPGGLKRARYVRAQVLAAIEQK